LIKNNRAYLIAKAACTRFERALADHQALPRNGSRPAEISALRAQIQDLQEKQGLPRDLYETAC
jgi:hypothetical protein